MNGLQPLLRKLFRRSLETFRLSLRCLARSGVSLCRRGQEMNNRHSLARVALVIFGAIILAQPTSASQKHPTTKPAAAQTRQKPVAYGVDGAPIATGAPRRLSSLAVGGSAWSAYHESHGKKRHQQIARR
jgi:hypothetical protein